jgi:hypothetical protein
LEHNVAINDQEGVEQSLVLVINAGGELFGVVRATVDDSDPEINQQKGFLLTRFAKEGERAHIVGDFSAEKGVTVGRNWQPDLKDAGTISRDHFQIFLDNSGKSILVSDLGSSNGTSVLRAKSEEELPENTPLSDISKWAPRSADVRGIVAPKLTDSVIKSTFGSEREATNEFIAEVPERLRGSIGGVAVAEVAAPKAEVDSVARK